VVHTFVPTEVLVEAYAGMPVLDPAMQEQSQQAMQQGLEEAVREHPVDGGVVCRAIAGSASSAIDRVADAVSADLIIVGATRHGAVGRQFLGTTAGRVIREACAPVLVLREAPRSPVQRVLLANDLSEPSTHAHHAGIETTRLLWGQGDLQFRSLLVIPYDPWFSLPVDQQPLRDGAEARLRRWLDEQRPHGVPLSTGVRIGNPAEEIITEAAEWKADLVVVGTHGRSGLPRLLLGSVAEAVLRDAPCNTLVIPNAPAPRGQAS
jgi:nucleotide-binding universal stress UspA family protein